MQQKRGWSIRRFDSQFVRLHVFENSEERVEVQIRHYDETSKRGTARILADDRIVPIEHQHHAKGFKLAPQYYADFGDLGALFGHRFQWDKTDFLLTIEQTDVPDTVKRLVVGGVTEDLQYLEALLDASDPRIPDDLRAIVDVLDANPEACQELCRIESQGKRRINWDTAQEELVHLQKLVPSLTFTWKPFSGSNRPDFLTVTMTANEAGNETN